MKLIPLLAYVCILLVGVFPHTANAEEKRDPQPDTGLYSDDEETVLEYLATHRVPHTTGQPSTPPGDPREVERAVELFKTGSHAVRLAIAKALPTFSNEGMKFWPLCGDEDYEAKHYLVGLAFAASKPEQWVELRDWLINEAHPSYATALLKNLKYFYFRHLFAGATEAEEHKLLAFLKELYRQPGHVVVRRSLPGDYMRKEIGGPVQEYVVGLLPGTPAASELLLEWISRDSKKVDQSTLEAMWNKWNPSRLKDLDAISRRRDVAESFLLSKQWGRGRLLDQPVFDQNVCTQVFNPDDRVRMEALRFAITLGGVLYVHTYLDQSACFAAIRGASATTTMRMQVLEEAKSVHQQLLKREENVLAPKGNFSKLANAIAAAPAVPEQ